MTPIGQFYRRYRRGSARRGIEFHISEPDFTKTVNKPCRYCGEPPEVKSLRGADGHDRPSTVVASGLDRVDNTMGYTKKNCVPCCVRCNGMKSTKGQGQFISHCVKVASHTMGQYLKRRKVKS